MRCFVQKVIVAGTEAGQPNNHCHQNRGKEKLAACRNARQSAGPSGNPGWIPAGDGDPGPAVCERVKEPGGTKCRCAFIP